MTFKPDKGVYPQSAFAAKEDYDKVKAERRKILSRHIWKRVGTRTSICSACQLVVNDWVPSDQREKYLRCPGKRTRAIMEPVDVMARWPSLVAHMICESLGYATPTTAAAIILDAANGRENWCEWVYSCYAKDPKKPLQYCIRTRHHHKGYMAEYRQALVLVMQAMVTGNEPLFASWF